MLNKLSINTKKVFYFLNQNIVNEMTQILKKYRTCHYGMLLKIVAKIYLFKIVLLNANP